MEIPDKTVDQWRREFREFLPSYAWTALRSDPLSVFPGDFNNEEAIFLQDRLWFPGEDKNMTEEFYRDVFYMPETKSCSIEEIGFLVYGDPEQNIKVIRDWYAKKMETVKERRAREYSSGFIDLLARIGKAKTKEVLSGLLLENTDFLSFEDRLIIHKTIAARVREL